MTNSDIREWYLRKVATIPDLDLEWTKNGVLLEARARRAWEIRHNARREARSMMENKAEVEALRRRDLTIYGNPDGPTFAQLIAAGSDAGLSRDEILRRIIAGAQTTNEIVNRRLFPKRRPK